MRLRIGIAALLLLGEHCQAARLGAPAERDFERYAANLEARLLRQHGSPDTYLAVLNLDAGQRAIVEHQLISGAVRIEPVNGGTWEATGALLHHWRAAAFVPHAMAEDMLALLRDYNHLSRHYAPQVVSSHALKENGDEATLAIRLKQQRVLTVVLDAEYEVQTRLIDNNRGYSSSRSKHIWQIDQPGTARESRRAEGQDDGFLWRLNSYWTFLRMRDGLLIECEAISLTRDIPIGLGWLITPLIEDLPHVSLEFTLRATQNALTATTLKEAYQ